MEPLAGFEPATYSLPAFACGLRAGRQVNWAEVTYFIM